MSALVAATDVLAPVAPTPVEVERMDRVADVLRRVAAMRVSGESPRSSVLLTRTVAGASSKARGVRHGDEHASGCLPRRTGTRRWSY